MTTSFLRQNRLKCVWTHQEKIEDNLSRKMMDMVVPGKRRGGLDGDGLIENTREDDKM